MYVAQPHLALLLLALISSSAKNGAQYLPDFFASSLDLHLIVLLEESIIIILQLIALLE